jgi:hypothetical protein
MVSGAYNGLMSAGEPSRSERDLNEEERRLLVAADTELRAAVVDYEPFLGKALPPGEPVPVVRIDAMAEAQGRIEAAEDHLWQLRERLLGWARPAWAPRASLVSDWFSDEDTAYDDAAEPTRS